MLDPTEIEQQTKFAQQQPTFYFYLNNQSLSSTASTLPNDTNKEIELLCANKEVCTKSMVLCMARICP